jgi:hypothetical protein
MADDSGLPVDFSFHLDAVADVAAETVAVEVAVAADITVELPGITIVVKGLTQPIALGVGPGTKPDDGLVLQATFTLGPTLNGAAVTVDLPAVTGSGELDYEDGSWVGALQLQIGTIAVDAFAVITPAHDGQDTSFVVVLCGRFPPPGIQIGFGFAVAGVGGVFGVNRGTNPDALTAAVLDHSLSALLFAHDAKDDSRRIVANLPAIFPPRTGQLVVGPMFELTWAAGLLTADLLMLIELPNPLRISFLGRLAIDLPVADAAIIHIEALVMASVTPGIPEFRMVASLTGSRIAIFALTGDLFLLIRGGPEATFILSAGGFHPAVHPPPGAPPLKRLGMVMGLSFIELRCESYLAVTTASVQFGALVELNGHIAGCTINAHLGFDALIEWEPQFHLQVDVHAGLTVEIGGERLCGVTFDGYLAGPGPWNLHGRAEVSLLFLTVPIPIDARFGSDPPALGPPPNVGAVLVQALSDPSAWSIHPPKSLADGVLYSTAAQAAISAGSVLHPAGGLQVLQHAIPLSMIIDRFGGQTVTAQRWAITGVTVDGVADPTLTGAPPEVSDTFADGTFTTLSADQQLSTTGFTSHPAGAQIRLDGTRSAPTLRECDIQPHDVVRGPAAVAPPGNPEPFAVLDHLPFRQLAATIVAPGAPVTVAAEPPTAVIADNGDAVTFDTRSAANDHIRTLAATGQRLSIVEQWELS